MATKKPVMACASRTRAGHAHRCAEQGCLAEVLSLAARIEASISSGEDAGTDVYKYQPCVRLASYARSAAKDARRGLWRTVRDICPIAAQRALKCWGVYLAIANGLDVLYAEVTSSDDSLWGAIEEMSARLSNFRRVFDVESNEELLTEVEEKWDAVVLELREQWGIFVPYSLAEKKQEFIADLEARL